MEHARHVERGNLHRGMNAAGRRAADQQGNVQSGPVHFLGHVGHLGQGRSDQPTEPDDVHLLLPGCFDDPFHGNHHAQIYDLVVVAAQHHGHDVLADVMHVALHCGHQHLAGRPDAPPLHGLQIGIKHRHGLFHDPGRPDHLGQEHLARPEQVADLVQPGHQGSFDDLQGGAQLLQGGQGILFHVIRFSGQQGMRKPFANGLFAPAEILFALALFSSGGSSDFRQALRGVRAPVEDHVLHGFQKFRRNLLVDGQLPRVDDAHVQPRGDGVVEENRVHGLPHGVVAPEAETEVADAAADQGAGHRLLDRTTSVDEIHGVGVVLRNSGGHGEHVGIEDHVPGREALFLHQDLPDPAADLDFTFERICLTMLVEGHDDDRRPVPPDQTRPATEFVLAVLQAERIDHALALDAPQTGLDDVPAARIDHHRHPGHLGIGGQHVEEGTHRLDGFEHGVVHVHVDNLRSAPHLLAPHLKGFLHLAVADQAGETTAARHVGPFADVDEQGILVYVQRFKTRQDGSRFLRQRLPGRDALDGRGNGFDVGGRRPAAAPHDVQQSRLGKLGQDAGHLFGCLVVAAQFVGQAGVGVGRDQRIGGPGDLLDEGTHRGGPQRAVQPENSRIGVPQGDPEGLGGLAGEGASAGVGDGAGDPDRVIVQTAPAQQITDGEHGGLGVERIENGFHHEDVGAAVEQGFRFLAVGRDQSIEGDVAIAGIVHVRGNGTGAVGRRQGTGHKAGTVGIGGGEFVRYLTGQAGRGDVEVPDQVLGPVVGLGHRGAVERVGGDDVRPRLQVAPIDPADHLRTGQAEDVVVALEIDRMISQQFPAEIRLAQAEGLDHGAHGPIEDENPVGGHAGKEVPSQSHPALLFAWIHVPE